MPVAIVTAYTRIVKGAAAIKKAEPHEHLEFCPFYCYPIGVLLYAEVVFVIVLHAGANDLYRL